MKIGVHLVKVKEINIIILIKIILLFCAGADLGLALGTSPFGWLSSPMPLENPSPESTLSFSLSSPPHQTQKNSILSPTPDRIADFLSSHFSPSIFSPEEINGKFLLRDEKAIDQAHSSFPLFDDPLSPDFMLQDNNRDQIMELKYKHPNRGSSSSLIIVEQTPQSWPVKTARALTSDEESTEESDNSKAKRDMDSEGYSTFKRQRRSHESRKHLTNNKLTTKKNSKHAVSVATTNFFTPESSSIPPVISPDQDFSRKLTLDSVASCSSQEKNGLSSSQSSTTSSSSPKATTISLKKSTIAVKGSNLETPTNTNRTTCNCKKSKCLKLYCDCFAVLNYCNPSYCNCVQCNNVVEHEEKRSQAVRSTKERNPLAFQTKISEKEVHVSGCHCKNSHCLKKYCECFTGAALCSGNCKCQSCKNFQGSMDLAKARENLPAVPITGGSILGTGSTSTGINSKKRKESPKSVAMLLENGSPDVAMRETDAAKMTSTHIKTHEYSLRTTSKESHAAVSAAMKNAPTVTAVTVVPPQQQLKSSPPEVEDPNPIPIAAVETTKTTSSLQKASNGAKNKKKKVSFPPIEITYPFFGPQNSSFPKLVALKCLDFLSDKDICRMSMVNSLWYEAANDAALWEYSE